MKKYAVQTIFTVLLASCLFFLGACGIVEQAEQEEQNEVENTGECVHQYDTWSVTKRATCVDTGVQTHICKKCGYMENQTIEPLGHSIVIDRAVKATCTTGGVTEGKHCSACGETIVVQEDIPALGHQEVASVATPATCVTEGRTAGSSCSVCNAVLSTPSIIPATGHSPMVDPAVVATCTTEGKTEGSHCSVCLSVITAQTTLPATGHSYDKGTITKEATCVQEGKKKFTCTVASCRHSYEESYSLPTYTATEIYNQSVQYVGEIITYDKYGDGLSIGTGFVVSPDGTIVTNYHVIDGAYYADITINGTTYEVESILVEDATIDLAVLKIDAKGLTCAKICKNPVSVGETVFAIGSSRGMTNTYSQGIVTYADRVVEGVTYVQHDASITNGNSGGPLINVYGEVIGINTWVMKDSQNLNFAIFTTELDNLKYDTSQNLGDLEQGTGEKTEQDTFIEMVKYIISNGEYIAEDGCYRFIMGMDTLEDSGIDLYRVSYYYEEEEIITLDLVMDNDDESWTYFEMDASLNGEYYWEYFDTECEMSGILYPATYDGETLLGYDYNNISSSADRAEVRELASAMIHYIACYISSDFSDIGVTAADFGFYNYK